MLAQVPHAIDVLLLAPGEEFLKSGNEVKDTPYRAVKKQSITTRLSIRHLLSTVIIAPMIN